MLSALSILECKELFAKAHHLRKFVLIQRKSREAIAATHPVGRLGEIDDVVEAIVYLENAPFVTGEILHVDGGQSAGH